MWEREERERERERERSNRPEKPRDPVDNRFEERIIIY
jgi:hypothetical protein